jgi:colicin import membrane protein
MARKPKEEAPEPVDMLALIDKDAPEGGEIVVLENAPPAVIARNAAEVVLLHPERFDQFYDRMRERTREYVPDVSTPAGRKECARRAFEVTKVKTTLDKAGLGLTEAWRAQTKAVNDARKPMVERLDKLAAEVRAPLTAWEDAEALRQAANEKALGEMRLAGVVNDDDTPDTVAERGRRIYGLTFLAPQWSEDEAAEAEGVKQATVQVLVAAQKRLKKEAEDAAELAALRAERAAREQREAEEAAAAEAKAEADRIEAARVEAEAQAERDRIAAEEQAARDKAEAEQAERDRIAAAAEAAAKAAREAAEAEREAERVRLQAEHDKAIAEANAERERIAAEAKAAEEKRKREDEDREAAAKAARDKAEAERQRIANEQAEADRLERERKANAEHRRNIIAEVATDIEAAFPGINPDMARDIANAIASGQIRHAEVQF